MSSFNSSTNANVPGATKLYSTFDVGGYFFGVDVLQVQEVLRRQELTPVPLAPRVVQGLINLRGQIVTAVDMRLRLGLPPRTEEDAVINVVVRTEDGAVSLLVDDIEDVVGTDAETFESPPDNLDPVIRGVLSGIHKLSARLLLVLDISQVLDSSAFSAELEHAGGARNS